MSIKIHKQPVIDSQTSLTQLQDQVAALAQYEEKLAELQKQQMRLTLKGEVSQGIQKMTFLANRINALGNQLEAEMLKFKKMAIETNKYYQAIQQTSELKTREKMMLNCWKPQSLWQVHYSAVPTVVKKGGVFVLTAKIVDLFQAEREKDVQRLAEVAQRRRKVFESWLVEMRRL